MTNYMTYVVAVFALLGAILVVGFFHTTLSRLLLGILARPCQVAVAVRDTFWSNARNWREWYLAVRQSEGMAEHNVFTQRILGALVCTAFLFVFLANEFHFGALSWAPYLGTDAGVLDEMLDYVMPGGGAGFAKNATSLVAAIGLVVSGLFWGMVLFDLLGMTHLAPWSRIQHRRAWMAVTVIHLVLILSVGFSLAEARMLGLDSAPTAIAQPAGNETVESMMVTSNAASAETAGFSDAQRPIARVLLYGHAGLMLTSSMAAVWGVVCAFILFKLMLARLLQGILYIFGIPFAAMDMLLNWIGQAIMNAYEFIARCCATVARPIGRWLGAGATDVDIPVGRDFLANAREPTAAEQPAQVAESKTTEWPLNAVTYDARMTTSPDAMAEDSRNWAPYSRPRA